MRKMLLSCLFSFLVLTGSSQPLRAEFFLSEGQSLWVQLDGGQAPSVDIDAMTLFWPAIGGFGIPLPSALIYRLYAPDGTWTGSQFYDPFNLDLSPFQGKDVIFEIFMLTAPAQDSLIPLRDNAWIAGEENVIGGRGPGLPSDLGLPDAPFYYAFYDYVDSLGTRRAIEYLPGAVSWTAPSHGPLFFELTITLEMMQAYLYSQWLLYPENFPDPWNQYTFPFSTPLRSDFTEPVPEPMTILLLGFGLVGLAGFRKRLR